MFPDEVGDLRALPNEYHPEIVDGMIKATETAQERVAETGLERTKVAAGSREKVARIGAGAKIKAAEIGLEGKQLDAGKVPPQVKWATDIVKKFSPKAMDPMIANLIETMNPGIVAQLQAQQGQIPENVRPIYNKALEVLVMWTGADVEAPTESVAGQVPWDQLEEPAAPAPATPAPAAPQAPYTHTATNPETGQKMGWDGTKWVPIQ